MSPQDINTPRACVSTHTFVWDCVSCKLKSLYCLQLLIIEYSDDTFRLAFGIYPLPLSLPLSRLVLFGTLACLCRQTQLMCDLFFGKIGVGVTLKDKGARELRKPSAEYTERRRDHREPAAVDRRVVEDVNFTFAAELNCADTSAGDCFTNTEHTNSCFKDQTKWIQENLLDLIRLLRSSELLYQPNDMLIRSKQTRQSRIKSRVN